MNARNRIAVLSQPSTGLIAMALAMIIVVAMPTSPARADYCEIIGCWTECRPVPGGRYCRRLCQRRCWRPPAPRYIPPPAPIHEPQHAAPSYAPVSTTGLDPLPGLLVLGGIGVIVALIIAALASAHSPTDDIHSATEETERETAATKALIAQLEAAARDADRHLGRFLGDTRQPPR
jgi:hypothetical protein